MESAAIRDQREPVDLLAADVGKRIRAARQQRGMSLAQVGGEDLSRSFLSLVELGRSRISLRALRIVADRLDLPISYFLEEPRERSEITAELTLDQAEMALAQQNPEECLRILDGFEASGSRSCRAAWLRGSALLAARMPSEAVGVLREAVSCCEGGSDERQKAQSLYALGAALYSIGAYDEALAHLRHAMDVVAADMEDPILLGKITVCMGHILYVRGDIDGAIEHYMRARDLFKPLGDLNALGSLYSGLSRAYYRKDDLLSALRYSKLSLSAFEARQDVAQAAGELNNVAVHYQELGDVQQALTYAGEAVERAQEIGARETEALARSTLASLHLRQGDLNGAVAEAQVAEGLAPVDAHPARTSAWRTLGAIAERRGDHDRADDLFRRALDALRSTDQHMKYADAALEYSLLLRQRGEVDAALDFALEAAQAKAARPA